MRIVAIKILHGLEIQITKEGPYTVWDCPAKEVGGVYKSDEQVIEWLRKWGYLET